MVSLKKAALVLISIALLVAGCATTRPSAEEDQKFWSSIEDQIDVQIADVKTDVGSGGYRCIDVCSGFKQRIKRYQNLVDQVVDRDLFHEPTRRGLFSLYLTLAQASETICKCQDEETVGLQPPPSSTRLDNGPPPMLRIEKK